MPHTILASTYTSSLPANPDLSQPSTPHYLDELSKFTIGSRFSFLHLNTQSLDKKIFELDQILTNAAFDIITFNETKLTASTHPKSFYNNSNYTTIRRDKTRHSGGILVFVSNQYKITSQDSGTNSSLGIEYISFTIDINGQSLSFISCYKPPDYDDTTFLDELEDILFDIDQSNSLFIIGDLNMDLLSDKGDHLKQFMKGNHLDNFVKEPTRIARRKTARNGDDYYTTQTLIDVILHNSDRIIDTASIHCPFSDHNFVMAKVAVDKTTPLPRFILGRKLDNNNLATISQHFNATPPLTFNNNASNNTNWLTFKRNILLQLDQFAPIVHIPVRQASVHPWIDDELITLKYMRDKAYKIYRIRTTQRNYDEYKQLKKEHDAMVNIKITSFFKDKKINDFNSSKQFWKFHYSLVNIKSDKATKDSIHTIQFNNNTLTDKLDIANAFNEHLTSTRSLSTATIDECTEFVTQSCSDLVLQNKLKPGVFAFRDFTADEIRNTLLKLSNESSAGASDIPVKLIKVIIDNILPFLTALFNHCIKNQEIPDEWKSAIVIPLYKNKGAVNDINNYRGISILPPLDKVFEKLISFQIITYINQHKLLFAGQYGFRANHSCESALHEILSRMKHVLSNRMIGLYLFIDFRKAFDIVCTPLLLLKLKICFGFDENAIKLIQNFFHNRTQKVKLNDVFSQLLPITLGVAQGSSLGPLLFLLFINDLPYFIVNFLTTLFADDTTLSLEHTSYDCLLSKFHSSVPHLLKWCKFNLLDINWQKSFIMFITNKYNITLPSYILIDGQQVNVVTSFKLLGIIIDNKLTFSQHISELKKNINTRLYSIKRLFFLSLSVKILFLKTFVMPYFDYCSTISIYFPKATIQRLHNCYNMCIFKLINTNTISSIQIIQNTDFNRLNNTLEKYGINAFQHRYITRFSTYIHKLFNNFDSPTNLFDSFSFNRDINKKHNLRNIHHLHIPSLSKFNSQEAETFTYFFSKFINAFFLLDLTLNFSLFKTRVKNNINLIFLEFVETNPKFDLMFKKPFIQNYNK